MNQTTLYDNIIARQTELAHSTCGNIVSANLCIKIALQSTLFQFNSFTIWSHATSEHQVRGTNDMLKIQTDIHSISISCFSFQVNCSLLYDSVSAVTKLYLTRGQTVSNGGPDGGLKLCWSLPSKESRMFSVMLAQGWSLFRKEVLAS